MPRLVGLKINKTSEFQKAARNFPMISLINSQQTNLSDMDNRLHKCPRPSLQSSYHDAVPLNHSYAMVYARETPESLHSQPAERVPQLATDSWAGMSSWAPPDDSTFLLDPDGNWYNVAVESHIMEDITLQASQKRKKPQSMVSVSLLVWPPRCIV